MSRPLTGSLKANPSGTFTAALPAARGSKDRVPATFDRRADAQAWLDDCVTTRKRDQPLPDPIRYKGRRGETVRTFDAGRRDESPRPTPDANEVAAHLDDPSHAALLNQPLAEGGVEPVRHLGARRRRTCKGRR